MTILSLCNDNINTGHNWYSIWSYSVSVNRFDNKDWLHTKAMLYLQYVSRRLTAWVWDTLSFPTLNSPIRGLCATLDNINGLSLRANLSWKREGGGCQEAKCVSQWGLAHRNCVCVCVWMGGGGGSAFS